MASSALDFAFPVRQYGGSKPEVIFHVLQQTRGSNSYTQVFGVARRNGLITDIHRHSKRKMATAKPEVVISHGLKQTDMRFQRS
jgi:hypothetical protein